MSERVPGEYIITSRDPKFYLGLIVAEADENDVIVLSVIKKHLEIAKQVKNKLFFVGYEQKGEPVTKIVKLDHINAECIRITLVKIPLLQYKRANK